MRKLETYAGRHPLFLFLLPLYFVWHGLVENSGVDLWYDGLLVFGLWSLLSFLLASLCWFYFRDFRKAALAAFLLAAFNFYFGAVHEWMLDHRWIRPAGKYSILLPASLLAFGILFLSLKRTKRPLRRLFVYLNLLLVLLILADAAVLAFDKGRRNLNDPGSLAGQFIPLEEDARPDVYLVVVDEYAGQQELKDLLHYDNRPFEEALRQRGFRVIAGSRANYPMTEYSMASLLNMEYLRGLQSLSRNFRDKFICRGLINENNTLKFFRGNGYDIYNFSFFEFNGKPQLRNAYTRSRRSVLTWHTFLNKMKRELGHHLWTDKKLTAILRDFLVYNDRADTLTRRLARTPATRPRFVYTHLNLPHYPYYTDSSGRPTPRDSWEDDHKTDTSAYLQYLVYNNRRLLDLVDAIRRDSPRPPVIILMSDHGLRQFPQEVDRNYFFMNLNSVYLPNGDYSGFKDGMSNVNQFRAVLNAQFGQRLPLLPDSLVDIRE